VRAALLAVLVGCTAPHRPQAPASAEVPITEELPPAGRFAPASPPASEYGAAVAARTRTPLDDAVLAALQRVPGASKAIELDERMVRAATDLAAIAPRDGELSDALVEFAVQRQGVVDPLPRLTVVWGFPGEVATMAAAVEAALRPDALHAPTVRIGIGVGPVHDGVAPIAVVTVGSRIVLEPLARTAYPGEELAIRAAIDGKLRDPVMVLQRPDGAIERPPVRADAPTRFTATIACGVPGRMQLELTATHPQGPIAIASIPVWCGVEPPAEYLWESSRVEAGIAEPAIAARRLVALINRDRRAAGLPLLVPDAEAAAAARTHAAAQRARFAGTAGAVPPPAIPGVAYSATHTRGLRAAYESLANVAGPRDSMLARTSTHVGAAVELVDGELFAALIYRKVTPKVDTAAVARDVEDRLFTLTKREPYRDLTPIAKKFARELVDGVPQREAWEDMRWWLDDLRYRFTRFNYVLTIVTDLDRIDPQLLLGHRRIGEHAVAVGQRDHPQFGKNAIWIVVLTAEYRTR
jgi:hypothetical protein